MTTFSDSIVIFSRNDSVSNFECFLKRLTFLLADAIIFHKIPLKGCIAYGEVSMNKSKQIFFGQPIIDAYLLEEEVNYLGIVCHHTINKYMNDKKEEISNETNNVLLQCSTPLKSGKIIHYNLDWFFTLGGKDVEKHIEPFYETVSGNARRYIDNTIELLNELKKQNKIEQ